MSTSPSPILPGATEGRSPDTGRHWILLDLRANRWHDGQFTDEGTEGPRGGGRPLPRAQNVRLMGIRESDLTGRFQGLAPLPACPKGWPGQRVNEPEVWELSELGLATPLIWLDLNNIHSTNIYPGRRRSQGETPPLAPGLCGWTGPLEGAVGHRGREVGRRWPTAEVSFGGTQRVGLALWHVHRVTQQQTGRRPMPGPEADPSAHQSQYLRSGGKRGTCEQATGPTGPHPGPAAAALLPKASQGRPGPAGRARVLRLPPQLQRGAPGGWGVGTSC